MDTLQLELVCVVVVAQRLSSSSSWAKVIVSSVGTSKQLSSKRRKGCSSANCLARSNSASNQGPVVAPMTWSPRELFLRVVFLIITYPYAPFPVPGIEDV